MTEEEALDLIRNRPMTIEGVTPDKLAEFRAIVIDAISKTNLTCAHCAHADKALTDLPCTICSRIHEDHWEEKRYGKVHQRG